MNRWLGLLGVAAICAAVVVGGGYYVVCKVISIRKTAQSRETAAKQADEASQQARHAAEPQHCKLELVRLEVLRPGAAPEPTQWRYRNVRPQPFVWQGKADALIRVSGAASEDDIAAAIKKEPKKYLAKQPLRGAVKLGSKWYGFVLDSKDKNSKWYDRLWFDRRGNGDLTKDKPIDAEPPAKLPAGIAAANHPRQFPRVDLVVEADGKKYDYSFFFQVDSYGTAPNSYVYAALTSAAYRRGEITLDGKKRKVVLLDNNSNGRFDDVATFSDNIHGAEGQIYPQYGDVLLIDPDKSAPAGAQPPISRSRGEQYLSKMNMLDGKFYDFKASPAGDELTVSPLDTRAGKIAAPQAPCTVELGGDQGVFSLNFENSQPLDFPAGRWRLLSYTITVKDWKAPAKHKAARPGEKGASAVAALADALVKAAAEPPQPIYGPPDLCTISARGTKDAQPITVEPGATTTLRFGPPYKLRITVVPTPEAANLGLAVVGSAGEVVSNLVLNGRRPDTPKLTVTDSQGKVAAEGDFEYG